MTKKMIVWVIVCALVGLDLAPASLAQTTAPGPTGQATATVPSFLEFSMKIVKQMDTTTFNSTISPFSQGVDVSASPTFAFGNLSPVYDTTPSSPTYGQLLYMSGRYFYYVLMMAATSGRRYKITEKGTQLAGTGGALLPNESVLMVPDYQWQDTIGGVAQLAPPGGSYLGPVGPATSTSGAVEQLVYQSGNATSDPLTSVALSRIFRAIIVIGGPNAGDTYPSNWTLGYNGTAGQGTKQSYSGWKPVTPNQASGAYTGSITFTLTLN